MHSREALRDDTASNIRGKLALDVARQAVAVGIAQLGDHRLHVAGNELVQHRVLGCVTIATHSASSASYRDRRLTYLPPGGSVTSDGP